MSDFKRGEPVRVHLGGKDKTPNGYEARAGGYGSFLGDWTRVEIDSHYFDFPTDWVEKSWICQVANPGLDLPCASKESGGYRCEEIGPHDRHRIGQHTIQHSLIGNGYACSAVPS